MKVEIPTSEAARVLILAASAVANDQDKETCRIVADFFDAIQAGPVSTTLGDNQTMRQVVDECLSILDTAMGHGTTLPAPKAKHEGK